MESSLSPALKARGRWRKALSLGLLLLLLGRGAGAQYLNTFVVGSGVPADNIGNPLVNYTTPINATNFLNNAGSTFTWDNSSSSSWLPSLYQGWFYTQNFTNNGEMDSFTGFRFDTQAGVHSAAANFYNSSTINCGSGSSAVFLNQFNQFNGTILGGFGGIYVNATNVINSGDIAIGFNGIAKIMGDNINFTRGTVSIASQGSTNGPGATTPSTSATSQAEASTNHWNPSVELTATTARGVMNGFFNSLSLFNSTPYFDIRPSDNTGTNMVVRMIFLQDNSFIRTNVYFAADAGAGFAHVEWAGTYVDSASGQTVTNYLYLDDDYIQGSSTNIITKGSNAGIPANYSLTQTASPNNYGPPVVPGFVPGLFSPTNSITNNIYSYFTAQLVTTSIAPNSSTYGTVAITNLPGRVEITAAKDMNLTLANLSGMNYLKLSSTNQFDYNQLSIAAPFSDVYLGNTNNSMVISNLLLSSLPLWSGSIQAWTTRWFDTNNATGTNYDFRVLLVQSSLSPVSSAQIQNYALYSSNNVTISDALNITGSFSLNCTNLLLTLNNYGNGAISPAGELNLSGTAASAWSASVPRLRRLVNNGNISIGNSASFVGSTNVATVTPGVPAVAATNRLYEKAGVNVANGAQVMIGSTPNLVIYKFTTAAVNNSVANQVLIGGNFDTSLGHLVAAINRSAGAGSSYSSPTVANPYFTAGNVTNHGFVVTARTNGVSGNTIATATSSPNLSWAAGYLAGGAPAVGAVTNVVVSATVPYDVFVNNGTVFDQGSVILANYFQNSGMFDSGSGSFSLSSQSAVVTNGQIYANIGGDISIATSSLVASNSVLYAAQSLVLSVSNLLTDTGTGAGNFWNVGGIAGTGFSLPVKPAVASLLGTVINSTAISNKVVVNTWSGRDFGASAAGYSNNAAVGGLVLDGFGTGSKAGQFYFTGTGTSNAIYVDYLELADTATNLDVAFNPTALTFNTNLVIYYAQAYINGGSVAQELDHKINNHLRWVPSYAGYYSSAAVTNTDGSVSLVNSALASSGTIDSNGDGNVNNIDPTPFFSSGQVGFQLTVSNRLVRLQWDTIPNATNYIFYRTNLAAGTWLPFTNFSQYYYGANLAVTNAAHASHFLSPQAYPSPASPVWIFDALTNVPHFYQVRVDPWLTYPY